MRTLVFCFLLLTFCTTTPKTVVDENGTVTHQNFDFGKCERVGPLLEQDNITYKVFKCENGAIIIAPVEIFIKEN